LGSWACPCCGAAAPAWTCACPTAAKARLLFTYQTENMIPQLKTTSPMRKSKIAMMVFMEKQAALLLLKRSKQEHLAVLEEKYGHDSRIGGDWQLGHMLFLTRLLNRPIKRLPTFHRLDVTS
jgi:hypothetical protein